MKITKEQEMMIVRECSNKNVVGASSIIINAIKSSVSVEQIDCYDVAMKALRVLEEKIPALTMKDKVELVKKVILVIEAFVALDGNHDTKKARIAEYTKDLSEFQQKTIDELCIAFGVVQINRYIKDELIELPRKIIDGEAVLPEDMIDSIISKYEIAHNLRLSQKQKHEAYVKIKTLLASLIVLFQSHVESNLRKLEQSRESERVELNEAINEFVEDREKDLKRDEHIEKTIDEMMNDNVIPFGRKIQ